MELILQTDTIEKLPSIRQTRRAELPLGYRAGASTGPTITAISSSAPPGKPRNPSFRRGQKRRNRSWGTIRPQLNRYTLREADLIFCSMTVRRLSWTDAPISLNLNKAGQPFARGQHANDELSALA